MLIRSLARLHSNLNSNHVAIAEFYASQFELCLVPCWGVTPDGKCLCRNPGCGSPGKHPLGRLLNGKDWREAATNDVATVRQWWSAFPQANIAHVPSKRGLVVIDLDTKTNPNVVAEWDDFLQKRCGLSLADFEWSVQTPSGGFHYYFLTPEPVSWSKITGHGLPEGVEILGRHLVHLPPSVTPKGCYRWNPLLAQRWKEISQRIDDPEERFRELFPEIPETLWRWCHNVAKDRHGRTSIGVHRQNNPEALKRWLRTHEEVINLLIANWPRKQGTRHDLALAVSGGLLLDGVDKAVLPELITLVAKKAGDREWKDRRKAALDTICKYERGEPITGWRTAKALGFPAKAIDKIRRLLRHKRNAPPSPHHRLKGDNNRKPPSNTNKVTLGDDNTKGLPTIIVQLPLASVAEQAWKALQQANEKRCYLFRRFSALVRLIEDPKSGQLIIEPLDAQKLLYELRRSANWVKLSKDNEWVLAEPPLQVAQDMLACPNPPLPFLSQLVGAPILVPSKTGKCRLLCVAGYDAESCIYLDPEASLPSVPDNPTPEDVQLALKIIREEFLGEFSFKSEADEANAIALLLLPVARPLITGPTPLHLITAPVIGAGKTLLATVLMLAYSERFHLISPQRSGDEWRKTITSALLKGSFALILDNLYDLHHNADLATALTTGRWSDRLLGGNEMVDLAQDCIWIATANNPQLSDEFVRRCVHIRLDPKCENPAERQFKKPRLRQWVRENRSKLWWSILVLVNNWRAQGCPEWTGRPFGGFEEWAAIVGGILEANGIEGFLANATEFAEMVNPDRELWRHFVTLWAERFGEQPVSVSELLEIAKTAELPLKGETDKTQATSLGMMLARRHEQVFGDWQIVRHGVLHGRQMWRLKRVQGTETPSNEHTISTEQALEDVFPF